MDKALRAGQTIKVSNLTTDLQNSGAIKKQPDTQVGGIRKSKNTKQSYSEPYVPKYNPQYTVFVPNDVKAYHIGSSIPENHNEKRLSMNIQGYRAPGSVVNAYSQPLAEQKMNNADIGKYLATEISNSNTDGIVGLDRSLSLNQQIGIANKLYEKSDLLRRNDLIQNAKNKMRQNPQGRLYG